MKTNSTFNMNIALQNFTVVLMIKYLNLNGNAKSGKNIEINERKKFYIQTGF